MRRIAGAFMLFGLAGCLSLPGQDSKARQTTADARPGITSGSGLTTAALPNRAPVSAPMVKGPTVDYMAARGATPYAQVQSGPQPGALPPLRPVPVSAAAGAPKAAEKVDPALRPVGHVKDAPRPAIGPAMPTTDLLQQPQTADARPARAGTPLLRLVNTKRITLNFEVKDVGPSGLAGMELWYTQDARDWKKYDAPTQAHAYVVEVDEEGMYGFTLLARSGTGQAKAPPGPADQPQVWVIVDLTTPDVKLTEVVPGLASGKQQVAIRWKATDKNFGRQPVSLFYAEKEQGPWQPIAGGLENTGQFVWQVPHGAPTRFLVRVEAADLAGNVGRAQTAQPVMLDTSTPTVSIVNVEANTSR